MNISHKAFRISVSILISIFLSSNILAQAIKTISVPVSWKDNQTVILSKSEGMKRTNFEYNIKSGIKTEIKTSGSLVKEPSVVLKEGDIYIVDTLKNEKRFTETKSNEKNPVFSPDFKKIAFTRENDLYSINIETGKETRHTFDGSDLILNGWASWVYYEEIFGRPSQYRAFWWSPDSKALAFYRFDDSHVPMFPIYNSTGQHGSITETRYPKAGDPNPKVKIGFVYADGGDVKWADFDMEADQYFGTPYWSPNGESLFVQWMNRDQNSFVFYAVNREDGSKKEIYREFQKTWIDWIEEIKFGKEGFYFVRDFDLWEHIYYQTYNGNTLVRLSDGKNWGTKIVKLDESAKQIYYTARCEASTRNDFYRASWNKELVKKIKRLSVGEYNYTGVQLSPDKKHFTAIRSNISTTGVLVLMATEKGGFLNEGEVKIIEESKGKDADFSKLPASEIMFIATADGYKLPASVIWPINMDRSKKYPVIINMYGGPGSSTVMDTWKTPGKSAQMWAEEGVIQISIDNRASGHCGKEGINFVHRNLGKYEIKDFIEWAKYLKALPFVDDDKIGITGYSYGGTMTLLALTEGADYFKFGIAGSGVYDWLLYDSHYSERYMDLPKDNPEGYKNSSVLEKVSKYKIENGSLLYISHGTGDDNVHMQNSIQLIDALQKAGKHFEFMLYPGGMHGYRGYQALHSTDEEARFWRKTLLAK